MNGTLAKIQRLLDQESTEFHRQAAELVIALADPEVDAWVLATTDWSESNDPETWDRGPMPSPRNRMLGADALSEVLSRSGSDAVPSRLFLTAPSARGFARMPGLTELVLKAGRSEGATGQRPGTTSYGGWPTWTSSLCSPR